MRSRLFFAVCTVSLLAYSILAQAQTPSSPQTERIRAAVAAIVGVQFDQGESAAIEVLQTCYRSTPEGSHSDKLEECLAQDIAYANFSQGMYRNALKGMPQPEYVSLNAMKTRVYRAAQRAGHSESNADQLLRTIAPLALQSLVPAIQAMKK